MNGDDMDDDPLDDWWRLLDGDEEDGLERRVEAMLEADEERWERWVDKL
jgi:hypothetical protein